VTGIRTSNTSVNFVTVHENCGRVGLNPETDLALARDVPSRLVGPDIVDATFVEQATTGFDSLPAELLSVDTVTETSPRGMELSKEPHTMASGICKSEAIIPVVTTLLPYVMLL
jgi:hypothetical protein